MAFYDDEGDDHEFDDDQGRGQKSLVRMQGRIKRESEKAVLFASSDGDLWIPKSQIASQGENDVMVPMWIYEQRMSSIAQSNRNPKPFLIAVQPEKTAVLTENTPRMIPCRKTLQTDKAIQVQCNNGKKTWFPLSQVKQITKDGDFVGVEPAEWLLKKKIIELGL